MIRVLVISAVAVAFLRKQTAMKPYGTDWYHAHSDKDACGYLCNSQCTEGPVFQTRSGYSAQCDQCRYNCFSTRECDKSEDCLVGKTISLHCYNQLPKTLTMPSEKTLPPWQYCEKYDSDACCHVTKKCIDTGCHYAPGSAQCGGVWGDCCAQRCLGAIPQR
eukprot:GEMP01057661.1.p1 GENE.GEMP01057661.1~~GEMP01057661.1.p1  ORF type:complete len:162 (+),score=29.06 GEMP01057661.1:305-790(+)